MKTKNNNIIFKSLAFLFACLFIVSTITSVNAASYDIVFKAGAYGSINGENSVTYNLKAGDTFPNEPTVTAKDGYVFTGWNKELPSVNSQVTGKQVYVAQYDLLIEGIQYMVRYVDQNNAQIATSKSMMGEKGSLVTERAKVILGYQYNVATQQFTLTDNTKVIQFIYELTDPKQVIIYEEERVDTVVPGGQTQQPTTGGNQTNTGNTDDIDGNTTNDNETIDDNETPLAKAKDSSSNNYLLYGGVIGLGVIILIGIAIVLKKKRKQE